MRHSNRFKIYVIILLVYSLNAYGQQSFEDSKNVFQDFCSLKVLENENVKDYSNISKWVNTNLENLFFGFGPYSLSSRNESGFMPLSVYDDGNKIQIPIYDNKIIFSPTSSPTKRAGRNRYRLKTECLLSILNYCNENFIKSFDYKYNSYFEIGAYRLNLNVKEIIAHTINTFVNYDYKREETSVEIFINEINKSQEVSITIPKDDKNNEFKNLVEALQSKYSEKQILNLIFETFLEKDNRQDTEEALNKFYGKFTSEHFITFINKELNYNLKIAFEDSGFLNISNEILELVNKDTKDILSDGSGYIKIPIRKVVDFNFAIDNVPRLLISFDIDTRDKKMYKLNTGFSRSVIKKYEKITKENSKYLEIGHINIVYYNDRIQITVSTSEEDYNNYSSYQIVNEKRKSLLPTK